jgi:O-succinylhomoserine sulfhydrylase
MTGLHAPQLVRQAWGNAHRNGVMAGSKKATYRPQTVLVRGGLTRSQFGEASEAIYMTSGFVYDSAEQAAAAFRGENDHYMYARYGNPTVTMFEQRLCELEGAEDCFATASGMAAVFASLMCQLNTGDRVVASRALFGSCNVIVGEFLPRYGIETEFVDGTDLSEWEQALSKPTTAVFLETPSNPTLEIIDLQAVAELAHTAGASLVIDNVFATPMLQQPLELGADVVVYSATKHIDGQGRTLGGAVLGTKEFVRGPLMTFLRHTGPALSAFNAWVLVKAMDTMELRVTRQCDNALEVARFLEARNDVARVLYPELASHPQAELAKRQMRRGGTMVSFELDGGKERAFQFVNALGLVDIANNLGDTKSLITHPATTTHARLAAEERERLGISDGLLRLSVGLEDVEDIKEDVAQALSV